MIKFKRTRLWQGLVSGLILMSLTASAELQNISVNGNYHMKEELRTVHISKIALDEAGKAVDYIRLSASSFGRSSSSALVQKVAIPAQIVTESYPGMTRTFLSFYLGRPANPQGDIDLAVSIGGHRTPASPYRVYTGKFTDSGWHPVLIDLRPWAGQVVDLKFQAGWLDGDASDLILGLPRLVSSHGPSYAGSGGLMTGPFHHGMPAVSRDAGLTIKMKSDLLEGGPLVIARFDAINASTMHMKSDVQDYSAELPPGIHWLPLQLPAQNESEAIMGCSEGIVERGPVDVIPNFMVDDEKRLEDIVEALTPPLDIPLAPQLFSASPMATLEP